MTVNASVSRRLLSRQYRQWCCRDAVFAWTAQWRYGTSVSYLLFLVRCFPK